MAAPIPPDKMKPEEVIAKHLASIGPADALAAIKSRIMVGNAKAVFRTGAIDISGVSQFASEDDKVVFAMVFKLANYPYEKAGYDGKKVTVSLIETTGARTILGNFIMAQDAIFRHGLIGGSLSSAWPLLNPNPKEAKISYSGTDKINGRQVHVLKYSPHNAGSLKISLYFDAETFQHVRTDYQYEVEAGMGPKPGGSVTDSIGGQPSMSHYKLREDFSDFRTEGKLTLPHTYKLHLTYDTQNGTLLADWEMNFTQFIYDQPIDAAAFNVGKSK
jgi:hypothetical protein